ncbi:NHL repeat-containing protein [Geobacter sp. DSM 9736]|uniref:NHL repeat-containing protein n=1 Tax=Geobacter sp. DSM 9736 TaxID=1277350 RepID=UPI000B508B72|nr:NHL repeat-containing protein [Geobacter sp. DSM 9736]SNB47137.1 NHL repeat-containing protein [Geobacter sp. DSM 9736]
MTRKQLLCLAIAGIAAVSCPVAAKAAENLKLKPAASEFLDDKGRYLKFPEGVACSKGGIVVADTGNGRLVRYSVQNDSLKPGAELKVSQLPYPTRVHLSSKGEILVLDGKQRRVGRISPDGAFAGYVDAGANAAPKSFAIDGNDAIYILDVRQERVTVLDPAGKKTGEIPFPGGYGFLSDIAVDSKGNILLLDSTKSVLYVAGREAKEFKPLGGSLREYLDFAAAITTDNQGRIYVTDQNGSAIIILGQDGSFQGRQLAMGRKSGLVHYPSQACIGDNGDFFLTDRDNSRVQMFKMIR